VRAYVSCVISCPYDGPTPVEDVRSVCERLAALGVDELDLGDTIGTATPEAVTRLYEGLGPDLEPSRTVLHLHDTNGEALACAGRALDLGVRSFDAACGGLGGCPYAPGASGNLATEALARLIEERGFTSGLDRSAIRDLGQRMRRLLGTDGGGGAEPPSSPD
ncbi:MAG: hydroxymethylglutaryl-CoA lyase, partial [Planctomycetota bacterium]|nr:hydroxymethylglutaryl-CoA lyase [Planctomycetota bacterium]